MGNQPGSKGVLEDKQLFTAPPPYNYQVIPRSCLTGD